MSNATPYRLTFWSSDFHTVGSYSTFAEAITAFAACERDGKALINDDLRDEGSGLTDAELDAVFSLPASRAATAAELATALACLEVA